MRSKWLYSFCFGRYWFQDSFKTVASLFSSYLAFSPGISLMSKWCSHKIVLIKTQLYFIWEIRFPYGHWPITIGVHALPMHTLTLLSVDEILLPRYMNWACHLMRWFHLGYKIRTLFYLSSCRDRCLLLPAPGNAAGIQLRLVYLQEVLDTSKNFPFNNYWLLSFNNSWTFVKIR